MITHQDIVEAYEAYRLATEQLDASIARQQSLKSELAALEVDIPRLRDRRAATKQALQDMLAELPI